MITASFLNYRSHPLRGLKGIRNEQGSGGSTGTAPRLNRIYGNTITFENKPFTLLNGTKDKFGDEFCGIDKINDKMGQHNGREGIGSYI
jgi:hypothetical protein